MLVICGFGLIVVVVCILVMLMEDCFVYVYLVGIVGIFGSLEIGEVYFFVLV